MMRLPRPLVVLLASALVSSCHIEEPFVRDSLWDPDADVERSLTGPDSTFSIGEEFEVTLTTDPPIPSGPATITWWGPGIMDTAVRVFSAGEGRYRIDRAHAEGKMVAVSAMFDGVIVAHNLMVVQKAAFVDMFCGQVNAQVPCDATPVPVNGTIRVNGTLRDARGGDIRRRYAMVARMQPIVRDPSVLVAIYRVLDPQDSGVYREFRGLAPGSTWVVFDVDGVRDSVRVTVGP